MSFMKNMKNALGDAIEDAKDFYELHAKSIVSGPVADMSFDVDGFDTNKTKFYQQFLSNVPDFKKVLKTMYNSVILRDTWKNGVKRIQRDATFLNGLEIDARKVGIDDINKQLNKNDANKGIALSGGANDKETTKSTFYTEQISKLKGTCESKTEETKKTVDGIYAHPLYSPDEANTTMTDRLIFIALTYVIRSIALFTIDWAINVKMVDTIEQMFFMYIITYILLFMVVVLLANTEQKDGMLNPFKLFFYYINTDHPSGVIRIYVHVLVQLFLFPIIYIAKENNMSSNASVETPYEFHKKNYRVLVNITMFMWMITSILCLRT